MGLQQDSEILGGKYHILRLLGEGGMARVWLAEEPRFGGRRVAIKEPRADLLPDMVQEVQTRYQREVQVCAALGQAKVPGVVGVFTTELYEDALLLVMEYMPGSDLAGRLREHPGGLPVEEALPVALDVLRALEGVHDHPLEIVHRDVKPSNILFDEGGRAHLGDFGLAQLAGMSGRSQLQGGQHPGTPMYMAPEQAASPQPLLPAADLYALGCVLFETLTGKRYKRVRPGTPSSALQPEVQAWLDGVLLKALEEDPWNRYAGATEMAAALQSRDQAGKKEQAGAEGEAESGERQARKERGPGDADDTRLRTKGEARQPPLWQQIAPICAQIGVEMVRIPEGPFLYGEKKERVHMPEYYLARTPVTNRQYQAFVEAVGHYLPSHWKDGTIPRGKEDHPVVYVNWHDATAFCRWAGCRLPSDLEWEKGARGSDGRQYPWGDEWELGRCNSKEAGINDTTVSDRFPNGASPYRLLDMAGNVWEWCENRKLLLERARRGGSWRNSAKHVRSAHRTRMDAGRGNNNTGFRCSLSSMSSP